MNEEAATILTPGVPGPGSGRATPSAGSSRASTSATRSAGVRHLRGHRDLGQLRGLRPAGHGRCLQPGPPGRERRPGREDLRRQLRAVRSFCGLDASWGYLRGPVSRLRLPRPRDRGDTRRTCTSGSPAPRPPRRSASRPWSRCGGLFDSAIATRLGHGPERAAGPCLPRLCRRRFALRRVRTTHAHPGRYHQHVPMRGGCVSQSVRLFHTFPHRKWSSLSDEEHLAPHGRWHVDCC